MSKLLLVEDDNNLREIYEARLQAEGYDIVTAKDGEDALAVAKAEKPDLIISDVMMPKISGFEMLDILKNTDGLKNVKVIMLTALGQSDDQQRADKLGADRYLVKSQVTLEDIVRVTHELLEDGDEEAVPTEQVTPESPAVGAPEATAPAVVPEPPVSVPPAPPAEPVVPVPVPEPPTAQPVAAPSLGGSPAPVTDDSNDQAMTTSEESANIENQIENFVEGATSSAPAPSEEVSASASTPQPPDLSTPAVPVPEPPTAPEPSTAEPVVPVPVPEPPTAPEPSVPPATPSNANDASVAAADEKLMNDAVNSLMDDSTPPVSTEEPAVAPQISAPQASTNPAQPSVTPSPTISSNTSGGSTMSHEKVINPPEDSTINMKPDLQALLAAEQAKEASAAPVAPAPPNTNVEPSANTPESKEPPIDPNSIAL